MNKIMNALKDQTENREAMAASKDKEFGDV